MESNRGSRILQVNSIWPCFMIYSFWIPEHLWKDLGELSALFLISIEYRVHYMSKHSININYFFFLKLLTFCGSLINGSKHLIVFSILVHKDDSSLCVMYFFFFSTTLFLSLRVGSSYPWVAPMFLSSTFLDQKQIFSGILVARQGYWQL